MIARNRPLALALSALALAACKSSDAGEQTGASITRAAEQIERGIGELDATVAALHAMADSPGDLKAQRKTFESSLSKLESTAEDVRDTAAEMRERGQAYFAAWHEQLATIQNEDIRERSAERREAIEASFDGLKKDYDEAKTAFEPLLANLRDIRTALRADSTVGGVDTLKPIVKKVDKTASDVSEELKDLADQFRELGVNLSRMNLPPPPEKK